jgi:hypothetical protein
VATARVSARTKNWIEKRDEDILEMRCRASSEQTSEYVGQASSYRTFIVRSNKEVESEEEQTKGGSFGLEHKMFFLGRTP